MLMEKSIAKYVYSQGEPVATRQEQQQFGFKQLQQPKMRERSESNTQKK